VRAARAGTDPVTAAELDMTRLLVALVPVAGRTCRYLWTVRAAIPLPVRLLLGLAMAVKCLPLDFGADETLTILAVLLLNKLRPGLVKACWRAAALRA
jgi:hypothetical protein